LRLAPRTIAIALVAALAVVAACRRYLPDLVSPFEYEDDVRQHVWWTYRFADPSLFPNDLAADYFSRFTFAPPGYQALARAFVPFVDAQVFSEIVPFALTGIVAVFAWLLGRAVSGGSLLGGVAAAAFALLGGILARVEGGLPRAWAMPVLLFGLWTLVQKRWLLAGVALVTTVLFYPPLVVNLGLLAAVMLAIEVARTKTMPRGWIAAGGLAIVAVVILWLEYRTESPDPFGPKVTEAQARAMPEFGPEGRSHFFSHDPLEYYISNERSGLGLSTWKLGAILLVLVAGFRLFPLAVPLAAWLIPLTSLAAYAAAHATLFKLHLPSRYTRFTLPAFFMLWIAAILPAVVERLRRFAAIERLHSWIARPAVFAILAAVALGGYGVQSALRVSRNLGRTPAEGYPELISFLSTLPVDAKIAAHPRDASDFPLLARRSVIACEETSTPYDLGYYAKMKERISAELEACYAMEWPAVDRLAKDFGAAVFVVNRARYPADFETIASSYFEPFRSALRESLDRAFWDFVRRLRPTSSRPAPDFFVLANPPPERILFASDRYFVVRLKSH
jgi:hypothetical protein